MIDVFNIIIAFNLGLFSTLHCLGMCGGIVTALSLGIPQNKIISRAGIVLSYNLGRILSYTIAGALAGAVGSGITKTLMPVSGHLVLQYLAAVVLVLIGLQLAGWLPSIKQVESLGFMLWRYLQPLAKHFLPVTNSYRGLMAGAIWGWLPCALVYSVLLWSLGSGGAPAGSLLMFSFGLGTLPGMFVAGMAGTSLRRQFEKKNTRRIAGAIIILFGIASPFIYSSMPEHQHQYNHNVMEHL